MSNLLTEEDRLYCQNIFDEGVSIRLKKRPENKYAYFCAYWYTIFNLLYDKIEDLKIIFDTIPCNINEALGEYPECSFTTIEEYYNILTELEPKTRKELINKLDGLSFVDKSNLLNSIHEHNYERFVSIIQDNKELNMSFEMNSIMAKKTFCYFNRYIHAKISGETRKDLNVKVTGFGEYVDNKYHNELYFDFTKGHTDEEWIRETEFLKWGIGILKSIYGDWFLKIDNVVIEKFPIKYHLPIIKIKELIHNTDQRLLNIFRHISIPEDADFALSLDDTSDLIDVEYENIWLYKNSKTNKFEKESERISQELKCYYKQVFIDEICDDLLGKTRFEVFTHLLDDFLNNRPKKKDYQILAKTIYNSKYLIKYNHKDERMSFATWYQIFCNTCGDVYTNSYVDQEYEINEKVEPFLAIFPPDPKNQYDKK